MVINPLQLWRVENLVGNQIMVEAKGRLNTGGTDGAIIYRRLQVPLFKAITLAKARPLGDDLAAL